MVRCTYAATYHKLSGERWAVSGERWARRNGTFGNNNTRIVAIANPKVRETSPPPPLLQLPLRQYIYLYILYYIRVWIKWLWWSAAMASKCIVCSYTVASCCWLCSCKTLYSSGIRNELNNLRSRFLCVPSSSSSSSFICAMRQCCSPAALCCSRFSTREP